MRRAGDMIGRVYEVRGRQVMVLARAAWLPGTPRNVLILQDDGTMTVRPRSADCGALGAPA
ncbi:MAG: hypothetical protein WBQ18_19505 [Solirubrobacteraceae bacterium]